MLRRALVLGAFGVLCAVGASSALAAKPNPFCAGAKQFGIVPARASEVPGLRRGLKSVFMFEYSVFCFSPIYATQDDQNLSAELQI